MQLKTPLAFKHPKGSVWFDSNRKTKCKYIWFRTVAKRKLHNLHITYTNEKGYTKADSHMRHSVVYLWEGRRPGDDHGVSYVTVIWGGV